jgi:hypothetical protein
MRMIWRILDHGTCESRNRPTQSDLLIGAMPNQCNLPISSPRWDIGLFQDKIQRNPKSELNSLGKGTKHCITWSTCVSEQSHRQNDAAVSPGALQRARSDESRPWCGGLGSPNHIKESIKIKPRAQGCHITSRDVTFNAEILHHGRDITRTQFEQGQPPEYALTVLLHISGANKKRENLASSYRFLLGEGEVQIVGSGRRRHDEERRRIKLT